MKKKVVIEKVPSSKKKVVIQGLPKADPGMLVGANQTNETNETDENTGNYYQGAPDVTEYGKRRMQSFLDQNPDLLETTDAYGNKIKTGDKNAFMQKVEGQVPFKTGIYEIGTTDKPTDKPSVNKKLKGTKPNVNWDFSKSNFGLFPLSGGKYAQRGFSYLNQIPGQIENAVSVFKTGKPTEKKQYPIYNPYVNAYWNYAEGGYLPKAQDGPMVRIDGEKDYFDFNADQSLNEEPEFRVGDEGWYESMGRQKQYPIENVNPMGFDSQGNITERVQSINPEPQLQPDLKKQKDKTKILKTIQKAGAVAAPVASTVLAGYNFAKQGLSDVGSNIANRKAQQAENQLYTQSVFSDAMNVTPYEEQGYGFTGRNALAADGMQIKQIGGMGEPNVEVEGEEHIQLPNGFSQEIQGKKHSEGGIPINLPQGTKIFSEKLKVPVSFLKEAIALDPKNQMLKSLKLPKTGKVSYADLAKKFETKKYVDLLNSKDADAIQMTTAQLMIQQNNAKLEELFGLQEQNKISGVHGPQVQQNAQQEQQEQEAQQAQMQGEQMEQPMMKYGGLYKAQDGKIAPNSSKVKSINTMYNSNETINGKPKSLGSFKNYSTVINSYPNMPNDTSYMYTQSNTPGKYEEFFYNTNQGKPIVQMRKGQDFIKLSPEETMGYKNKVLTGVGGFKYGGYHLPKAQAGKTSGTKDGIWIGDKFVSRNPIVQIPFAPETSRTWNAMTDFKSNKEYADAVGYTGPLDPKDEKGTNLKIQEFVGKNYPELVEKYHSGYSYGMPFAKTPYDSKLGIRWRDIAREIQNLRKKPAVETTVTKEPEKEPEQKPGTPPAPQVINQTYEVPGLNLGIALPNVYERMPLNYYKIEPEYIDPRYLDIQPQLNRIGRGQRAIESTLGSRGSSDMANLLQAQANRAAAEQEAYGQKYNYDRAQDAAAQQFNAQAKMNANQYNQGSWFQQLEDPIRRRESLIGTQQMMDDQAAIENARKMQAFYGNKDFIGNTFYPAQGMTMQDVLTNLTPAILKQYQADAAKQSKAKTDENETTQIDKYGGKVKKKIKIKPKLKNSYF